MEDVALQDAESTGESSSTIMEKEKPQKSLKRKGTFDNLKLC